MQSNPMEFLKEAAIMHSIEHENIVRLYGVVLATDSLMLVTELALAGQGAQQQAHHSGGLH